MVDMITEIGPASLVKGEIEAQEDVAVFGRVEGVVRSTETVTIEEDGVVDGEIEAAAVVVAGIMLGNIRAVDRVEILETGAVQGDISTPVMVLIDGGAVKGKLIMDESEPEPVKVSRASRVTGAASSREGTRTGSRTTSRTRSTASTRQSESTKSTSGTRRTAAAQSESLLVNEGASEVLLEENE